MWLIAVISGIGIWLLLATVFIAVAVSAARGDVTEWVDEFDEDFGTVIALRDAA